MANRAANPAEQMLPRGPSTDAPVSPQPVGLFTRALRRLGDTLDVLMGMPRCRRVAGVVVRALKPPRPVSLTVQGHRMTADTFDRLFTMLLWKYSALEAFESRIIRGTLKPGMRVIDIGANIGFHTLQMARLVGPAGRVFAFEPSPTEYAALMRNIASNRYDHVTAMRQAVADATDAAALYYCEEHRGDHRTFDLGDGRRRLSVVAVAIDDVLAGEAIDLIKMDIQGAEDRALAGMDAVIRRNKHLVLMSAFSPPFLEQAGAQPGRFLDRVLDLGFTLRMIDERRQRIEPVTRDALLSRRYANLYLTR